MRHEGRGNLMATPNRPKRHQPPPRLARWYPGDPPRPIWWEDYPNPAVVQACRRWLYLDVDEYGGWALMTQVDGRWLRAYLQYIADCPRPDLDAGDVAELRRRAYLLGDRQQVGDWLQDALECGVDVFGGIG